MLTLTFLWSLSYDRQGLKSVKRAILPNRRDEPYLWQHQTDGDGSEPQQALVTQRKGLERKILLMHGDNNEDNSTSTPKKSRIKLLSDSLKMGWLSPSTHKTIENNFYEEFRDFRQLPILVLIFYWLSPVTNPFIMNKCVQMLFKLSTFFLENQKDKLEMQSVA